MTSTILKVTILVQINATPVIAKKILKIMPMQYPAEHDAINEYTLSEHEDKLWMQV